MEALNEGNCHTDSVHTHIHSLHKNIYLYVIYICTIISTAPADLVPSYLSRSRKLQRVKNLTSTFNIIITRLIDFQSSVFISLTTPSIYLFILRRIKGVSGCW